MNTALKRSNMSFTEGPLLGPILRFTIPLMLSNILQLLYNAADTVIVGRFGSTESLAAVGSTTSMISLAVNLFAGLSIGVSVMVAQQIGAKKENDVSQTVHTAILVSIYVGVLLMAIGIFGARTLLLWMETPPEVIDLAVVYVQVYFIGMPASMLYNFGSAVMRAAGDSKRPLYYLSLSGLVNVALNLVFVIVFRLDVVGVGLASTISQILSAVLVMRSLVRTHECYRLEARKLHIHKDKLTEMIRLGLPAGIQNSLSSIGNLMIQSSVNLFGAAAMAGKTVAQSIESFVFTTIVAFSNGAITFTGQNVGAKKYDRIKKITNICCILITVIGIGMAAVIYYFRMPLFRIYTDDPLVMDYATIRMKVIITTYFLGGLMHLFCSQLRAMGVSVMPMVVASIGQCVLPIVWVYTAFAWTRSLEVLYASYPVAWILTGVVHVVCYFITKRKLLRSLQDPLENE